MSGEGLHVKSYFSAGLAVALAFTAISACQKEAAPVEVGPRPFMSKVTEGIAVFQATEKTKVAGIVRFAQSGDDVKVTADFNGLAPKSSFSLHVHELGNCSDLDKGSAGGHYTPHAHPGDQPEQETGHSGNLGEMSADASGNGHFEGAFKNGSLAGVERPVIGRAMVVDANPVDAGAHRQSTSACSVIGIAKVVE